MKKSLLIRYISLAIIVIGLTVLLLFISGKSKSASYQTPPPAIEVSKPVLKDISQSITLSGYIEARSTIPVIPLVSGIITEYPASSGNEIKKGDVIAKIDESPFLQQMYQARAAYLGYESTFERIEALYSSNSTTKQNYESAKAQRDASKAQYELSELQLGYATVTAPTDGTILSAPSAVGNIGTNTQPLAIIADLTDLVVRLNVPEKYFDLFNENKQNLSAHVIKKSTQGFSDEKICEASIDTIAPYIQSDSKTFQVVFSLIGDTTVFKPGMYIQVEVVYQSVSNVPALPLETLKVDGSCYIYDNVTNIAVWTTFPVDIQDSKYFMVPKQYADSLFIVSGQNTVFDGQTIGQVTVKAGE